MSEAGGRRIKRSIVLKPGSIKFCNQEMISRFENFHLIKEFLSERVNEIQDYNLQGNFDKTYMINGRQLTNIGVFRVYIELYIKGFKGIHPELTRMVYQNEGNEYGVPIQIYCFTETTDWAKYETIQSDIFDHLYAAAPDFDLEVFQHPSGADFNKLIK